MTEQQTRTRRDQLGPGLRERPGRRELRGPPLHRRRRRHHHRCGDRQRLRDCRQRDLLLLPAGQPGPGRGGPGSRPRTGHPRPVRGQRRLGGHPRAQRRHARPCRPSVPSTSSTGPSSSSTQAADPKPSWREVLAGLRWKRIAAVAGGIFVVAMLVIVSFELLTGRAVSSYTGGSDQGARTSIPGVGAKRTGGTPDKTPAPTQQPSSGESTPAPSSTPTPSETPTPTPAPRRRRPPLRRATRPPPRPRRRRPARCRFPGRHAAGRHPRRLTRLTEPELRTVRSCGAGSAASRHARAGAGRAVLSRSDLRFNQAPKK